MHRFFELFRNGNANFEVASSPTNGDVQRRFLLEPQKTINFASNEVLARLDPPGTTTITVIVPSGTNTTSVPSVYIPGTV